MANHTNRKTINITFATSAAFTTALMLVKVSYQRKAKKGNLCL